MVLMVKRLTREEAPLEETWRLKYLFPNLGNFETAL